MKNILLPLLAMASLAAAAQQTWPDVRTEMRPGTRWWWQGSAVESQRLDNLLDQYAAAGIGTVEITPLYGVQGNQAHNISYLSTPWMEALQTVENAASRNQMDVDMNGGTGWPFGGPYVKLDEAAAKLVTKTEVLNATGEPLTWSVQAPEGNAALQCVMAYQGAQAVDLTERVSGNSLTWTPTTEGQWRLVAVYCGRTLQAVKRAAPGGEGYVVDHYDSASVANYLKVFDRAFNRGEAQWPHSFFCDSYEVYGADWTPRFLEQFMRLRGYDLRQALPQLLALSKDSVDVQHRAADNQPTQTLRLGPLDVLAHYRQTLSDLLMQNFTLPWTQWAHSHGVTTRLQAHGVPGPLLDFYAAADIPEIEGFGLTDFALPGLRQDPGFTRQNYSDFATLKYASSAAHVTGKPLVSSETFTWLTEHFRTSLSQMKPDLDLMLAAGVNHIFFHGTAYTPDPGSTWPAAQWPGWHFYASIDMSPGNSLWRDAPAMMQYATRCQSWLQQGTPDNDFLVYANFAEAMHKNTGTWANRLLLFDINTLSQKMPSVVKAQTAIEKAGYDCDFISDQQLQRLTLDGASQCLVTEGGTRYRAIVVPSANFMPQATSQHLALLQAQGARIVYAEAPTPAALDTLGATPEPQRMAGLKVLRRKTGDGKTLRFVANLTPNTYRGVLSGASTLFDPMTGHISQGAKTWLTLQPGESVIAVEQATADAATDAVEQVRAGAPIIIDNPWTLSFTEGWPQIGQTFLLDTLRSWEGLTEETARYMGTGIYETTFTLTKEQLKHAPRGFRLDLGDVRESARVYVNGDSVATLWAVPFTVDIAAGEQNSPATLREGLNTLRIEVTNLPANRISQMDRDGVVWRLFEDVNMLGIVNGSEGSRVESYASWAPMPSGLNSNVRLLPLLPDDPLLDIALCGMKAVEADGQTLYWPIYSINTNVGQIASFSLNPTEGSTNFVYDVDSYRYGNQDVPVFIPYTSNDGRSEAIITVTTDNGFSMQAWLPIEGAFTKTLSQPFNGTEAPASGWSNAVKNGLAITGFAADGRVEAHTATAKGTEVGNLYEGLVFNSASSNTFYLFPGFGMQPLRDCTVGPTDVSTLRDGDMMVLTKRVGDAAANLSLHSVAPTLDVATCTYAPSGMTLKMSQRAQGTLYEGVDIYRPLQPVATTSNGIATPRQDSGTAQGKSGAWHNLQGQRVGRLTRPGVYLRAGRKVVVR